MPPRLMLRVYLALPVFLLSGPSPAFGTGASSAPPPEDVAEFVAAERAFSADAAARGITPAFIAALAAQAILFRPGPVDGQAWLAAHPGTPDARLAWEPGYAEASIGGDLGWTTGPWDFRRTAADAPIAFGHYVTVWRRQADGSLRAVLDAGHGHERSAAEPLTWTRAGDSGRRPRKITKSKRVAAENALFEAERAYAGAIGQGGWARALATHADRDVRVARDGTAPTIGSAVAGEALGAAWAQTALAWSAPAGGASDAGDLGYTYGTVTPPDGARQAFLHLWRNPDGKRWRLALDLLVPAPEPAAHDAPPTAPTPTPQ